MNEIQKLATSFVKEHWDVIDIERTEIENDLKRVLKLIKNDEEYAGWIVGEVMAWGTPTNYLKPYLIEADIWVIKVDGKYFKIAKPFSNLLIETFPKEKTVIYFD